jgi:hypothetical protein
MERTPSQRLRWIPGAAIAVGAAVSILFYGMRPFYGGFLGSPGIPDQGCGFPLAFQRCSGTITTVFAGDLCGLYARHRQVVLIGLIGLWTCFGAFLRQVVDGAGWRSFVRLQRLEIVIPAAVIGVVSGLWSYGFPDPCNSFVSRIEAGLGGLGVALASSLLGHWALQRQSRASLTV